jgi:hypothetical protein
MRVVTIGVIRPEHRLDRPSSEIRAQAVIADRCGDRGDADRKSIKRQLDVDRRPRVRRPKRLSEAEAFVEPDLTSRMTSRE